VAALVVIYGLFGGGLALRAYFSEHRRWDEHHHARELSALESRVHEADLRLGVLQAQVEPHFLFNTLNTGAALLHARPGEAEQLLLDLADLFRGVPSVSVGGGVGVAQKIYVRGLEDSLLNVTIDGAPQRGTLFHHIGRVTIEPELLETVMTMFDWPEQNQTSPAATFLDVTERFPIVTVKSPSSPASNGPIEVFQLPSFFTLAEASWPANLTTTLAPAVPHPQMGTGIPRWTTALSPRTTGSFRGEA